MLINILKRLAPGEVVIVSAFVVAFISRFTEYLDGSSDIRIPPFFLLVFFIYPIYNIYKNIKLIKKWNLACAFSSLGFALFQFPYPGGKESLIFLASTIVYIVGAFLYKYDHEDQTLNVGADGNENLNNLTTNLSVATLNPTPVTIDEVPMISSNTPKSLNKNKIIAISSVFIIILLIGGWIVRGKFVERERLQKEKERVQFEQDRTIHFEYYKNSILRIENDFKYLDSQWNEKNRELFDLGKYNEDQVSYGRNGFSTIGQSKDRIRNEIRDIEAKMKNSAMEATTIANNFLKSPYVTATQEGNVQNRISRYTEMISKIDASSGNSKNGVAPSTGDSSIDQALSEFPNDQNLRGLVDLWKGYKDIYDAQEQDLTNRIRAGQLPASVLSALDRANQRSTERLIREKVSQLRQNR